MKKILEINQTGKKKNGRPSMNKSESIAALAEALAKAQGMMKGALKDVTNPYFKSKYADLSSVWEACREALSSNGLAVVQTNETDDAVVIETVLLHSSGEWIAGRLRMIPKEPTPQGVGSCITYARRYALAAMVGVAPEDDDGNEASKEAKNKPRVDLVNKLGLIAQMDGTEALKREWALLTVEQKKELSPHMDHWKSNAIKTDAAILNGNTGVD